MYRYFSIIIIIIIIISFMQGKKVKFSRYRPGQALGGSRKLRLQNLQTIRT
jgi:hypothetical protein